MKNNNFLIDLGIIFRSIDGCKYINDIKLVNCAYIGNEALSKLNYLRNSLKNLEISNCTNVTESGLNHLKQLTYVFITQTYFYLLNLI